MNEITQIHLGRSAFTVSVEAHKELREYLNAIKTQVGKNAADVVEEVELRMAELLTDRGINGDKVVLPADITYLKEQLGEPRDFKDEGDEERQVEQSEPRRLFRDTEHGMIAGVSSGLAAYFGIDAVIIRILFVALTFAGASGLLIYLLLWLIVPEAKTQSDRLQMQGKAVTVDSLKEVVAKADVPGAAHRAGRTFGRVLEAMFKATLAFAGAIVFVVGLLSAIWAAGIGVHYLLDGAKVAGEVVFPMGTQEHLAFASALITLLLLFVFMVLIGLAMIRRRWQMPGWGVATLFGLFFLSASVAGAMAADVVPRVHDRVQALHHSKVIQVADFTQADLEGKDTRFVFVPDTKTYVEYRYFGNAHIGAVKTQVENGKLEINTDAVGRDQNCNYLCIYSGPDLYVMIHAPQLTNVSVHGDQANFYNEDTLKQTGLSLTVGSNSLASLDGVYPAEAVLHDENTGDRTLTLKFGSGASVGDGVSINDEANQGIVSFERVGSLSIENNRSCDESDPFVFVLNGVQGLQLNGKPVTTNADALRSLRNPNQPNIYNCVSIEGNNLPVAEPLKPQAT